MDSKATFGILMVIIGLGGMWLLITGRLNAWMKQFNIAQPAAASTAPAAKPNTGTKTPTTGGSAFSASLPLGSPRLAYGIAVGDGGAHIEPLGAVGYGTAA